MVHLALALVAILVELSPPASGFGIVSYQPRDNVVEAKVGDSVRLECVADSVLKRCAWFHVDTRTGCELGYSHETSGKDPWTGGKDLLSQVQLGSKESPRDYWT